jgi:DNA polymerase-3 subunit delta
LISVLKGESIIPKIEFLEREYGTFKTFDLESEPFEILINTLKSVPMFQEKVILFIKSFDSLKKSQKKELLKTLKELNGSQIFEVFIDSQTDIEEFKTIDFSLPKPWEFDRWISLIKKMAQDRGLNFDEDALITFYERCGPNYDKINQELEKLRLYSDGKIDSETVEVVVHDYGNASLDDMLFAISTGDVERLNSLFEDVLETVDLQLLLYMLGEHFVFLFKILCVTVPKDNFSWKDVQKIAKELSMSSAKVARYLGFKFKGQRNENINHTKLYTKEKVSDVLEKIINLQREFKTVESSKTVLKSKLIELAKMVYN